ncbi:MAG TPA: TIGR03000 domain-containing protein [Vicinamibacterales bacterium]|nr:TIGR03000 domain-containing protein [Vicinamibacterales bacterium]
MRNHMPLRTFASSFVLIVSFVTAGSIAPAAAPPLDAAARQATARRVASRVAITVPAEDAELTVNGAAVPGSGMSRTFDTGLIAEGTHKYTVSVTWEPNTYTKMTRTKVVTFRAGEAVRVDLTVDDPADRVRVIYVPTPPDVAAAMVQLAAVRESDVIYEPGCGDARITIAAIRAGARRGICVDIDPERARESKANVETAGFANRIDVREGDALDVKNLSDVSVVFLYMGDHFDMLIRPVLWRELKVGSRIVSHRFTMGDWKPDRTISVSSDDGVYDLHLWTITEELKRRSR